MSPDRTATTDLHRSRSTKRYLSGLPRRSLPEGRVVAHNRVRPHLDPTCPFRDMSQMPLGWNGFRAWEDDADDEHYEPCDCGWRTDRLPVHYRVKRPVS